MRPVPLSAGFRGQTRAKNGYSSVLPATFGKYAAACSNHTKCSARARARRCPPLSTPDRVHYEPPVWSYLQLEADLSNCHLPIEGAEGPPAGELRADQLYDSALPPFKGRATRVDQYRKGLWAFTQPLPIPLVGDPDLRMTVARLQDGSLWIHSPVAPTGEVLAALAGIGGRVAHIVLPNTSPEHWYFGPAMAAAFPGATVWVAPGILEGKRLGWPLFSGKDLDALKDSHTICTLEDGAPAEWGGEVAVVVLNTAALVEAALILRTHKALLVSDTLTLVDASYAPSTLGRKFAEMNGIWNKLGPQAKLLFDRYPTETIRWVKAILEEDFDLVVPAHTVSPVNDGKTAVRDCFQWLLTDAA